MSVFFRSILCFFFILIVLFAGYGLHEYTEIKNFASPLIGNQLEKRQKMEEDLSQKPYSFFVIGDTRSRIDILEKFLRMMKKKNPAFLVHLGDFVINPLPEEHRFFITEIKETGFDRPVFLIPGNHDISPLWPFSQKIFEDFYGPTCFYFKFRGSLFIFLCSLDKTTLENSLNFSEKILQSRAKGTFYRFLFLHCPPNFTHEFSTHSNEEATRRLIELTQRYKINYVFIGHLHRYLREEKGGCIFISPGSGGATLRKREIDPYYHCLEIMVSSQRIKERLYSTASTSPLEDQVEFWLCVKVLPRIIKVAKMILPSSLKKQL